MKDERRMEIDSKELRKLTLGEVIKDITERKRLNPDREFLFDGDDHAWESQPRRGL